MKKTKIVCTIGPKTESEEMLTKMLKPFKKVKRIIRCQDHKEEKKHRFQIMDKTRNKTGTLCKNLRNTLFRHRL